MANLTNINKKVKDKKRIKYIDIAKGITILLMVAGHSGFNGVDRFVNQFHMILFIFLSGFFFNIKCTSFSEIKTAFKKRCLPLYLFYIKCNLIFYLFTNLFYKIGFLNISIDYGTITTPILSIKQLAIGIIRILSIISTGPLCLPLWFIASLILINIMCIGIIYISSKQKLIKKEHFKFYSILGLFAFGLVLKHIGINIPRVSPALTMIIFFYIGNLVGIGKIKVSFNNIYIFVISLISLFVLNPFGTIHMIDNTYTNVAFLFIMSFFGIYSVLYICRKIELLMPKVSTVLSYIGKHTLPILALHLLCFKIVSLIQLAVGTISIEELGNIFGVSHNHFLWSLLYFIIGVTVPLLLNLFAQKIKYNFFKFLKRNYIK